MKTNIQVYIVLISSILITLSCNEKLSNPEYLLQKSFEECQRIDNGYYEMTEQIKYYSSLDTTKRVFKCYFTKNHFDSIFSSFFKYDMMLQDTINTCIIYNGKEFVSFSYKKNTGYIMKQPEHYREIKSRSHNQVFYSPFTERNSFPIFDSTYLKKYGYKTKLIEDEVINGSNCYHVQIDLDPIYDSSQSKNILNYEVQYWINKDNFLPLQYSIKYVTKINNDTVIQYENISISKYEINIPITDSIFNLNSIPRTIKLSNYISSKKSETLCLGSEVPDWTLNTISDQELTLSKLRGNLVIVDFFYKSCHPCIRALPALQNLHKKYNEKGVIVVGIDPFDDIENDNIDIFIKNQGVTYPILLGNQKLSEEYHISGYPSIFIIDKQGKLLSIQEGYGDGVDDILEQIIIANL